MKRILITIAVAALAAGIGWAVFSRSQHADNMQGGRGDITAAPVEVAAIEHGPIVLRRTFSGTLEAASKFVVAPKVAGRIKRLHVNLADSVRKGQVVAELDDDEYVQEVAQAKADLAVARAHLAEAHSALKIADRDLERIETLRERGVISEAQFDAAKAEQLAKQVRLEVAQAQLVRAVSALETANIRLGYTKITADWSRGNDRRVVAERYVDEGETVSANAPLLLIVELDPVTGVIFVTEKDYVRMKPGQSASLTTDSFPGEVFQGRIIRIAPVFRRTSRQARIELTIDNPHHRLKPGMFIRAEVVLDQVDDAVIVPDQALTTRSDRTGVFIVNEDEKTVQWRDVKVGIREGKRVQVEGRGLAGRVVILGQQLVDDGSRITIPKEEVLPASSGDENGTK